VSNLDWPRGTRSCDGGEEEREALAQRMRNAHERAWAQHESVKTRLRRHFPEDWGRVKTCRMDKWYDYKTRDHAEQRNLVMLRPQCRDMPFCPACNDVATYRRASGLVKRIAAGTPAKKKLRGWIFTVGISPLNEDWRLPRLVASDLTRFKRAIYRACEGAFGKGVGALAIYQHYGQDVLVRERPHVHVLVNGWRLDPDGKPMRTPEYDLKGGGRARLTGIVTHELNRAFPEAGNPSAEAWYSGKDINIQALETPSAVAQCAKYMARELIDFRDFQYDALKRLVYVNPYREQGPAVIDVPTLQRNLSLYNARFQPWASEGGRRVFDSAYGELSDRRAGETAAAMGAHREHRDGCWCRECSNWSRLMAAEIEGVTSTLEEDGDGSWKS